jgi:hypothetical protein
MATRRRRIYEIAETERPASVRQIYYQTVVQKVSGIEKDDAGYDKAQDLLTDLRRGGVVPFEWIIDEGRYARQPYAVEGIPQALNDTRRNYRKDPWKETFEYVQIWVEKNALVGVLEPVTREYDVPLMSAVGYSSISYRDVDVLQGGQLSCELDAIRPTDLRRLVRQTIERHLPRDRLDMMNARGDQERLQIGGMLDRYLDELHDPAPITVRHNGRPLNGHWIGEYLAESEKAPPPAWSSFGSDHADVLYPASRIKEGAAP